MSSTHLAARPAAAAAPSSPSRRRTAATAGLLLALVLSVAACSAGSTVATGTTTTGPAATPTTAPTADAGVRGGQAAEEGDADADAGGQGGGQADGPLVDPDEVDTEEGGQGDVLPPDEGIVDEGAVDGGVDAGDGGAGGGGAGDAGGGTAYPAGPVIGGVPLDMSQPFDVGREWAIAANYGDFALVDRLSCANDARAVAQGQIHQASLAALRQTVVERFEPLDDHQGYLYWSVQKVQLDERVNGRIPMILEADGWKVCYYPQF